jgi:hypothetical protein
MVGPKPRSHAGLGRRLGQHLENRLGTPPAATGLQKKTAREDR